MIGQGIIQTEYVTALECVHVIYDNILVEVCAVLKLIGGWACVIKCTFALENGTMQFCKAWVMSDGIRTHRNRFE